MDNFGIPKKVNRHVLKALRTFNDSKGVSIPKIVHQVEYQMRDLVPVRNLNEVVQKSLRNLTKIGLVDCFGNKRFAIGCNSSSGLQQPAASRPPGSIFQTGVRNVSSLALVAFTFCFFLFS